MTPDSTVTLFGDLTPQRTRRSVAQTSRQTAAHADAARRARRRKKRIAELYAQFGKELWAMLYAHCGDRERSQDAVQEAFLRLQRQDLDSIRDIWSWLLVVGRNWLRDVAKRRSSSERHGHPDYEAAHDRSESPYDSLLRQEDQETVRAAMGTLSEPDRQVLSLKYGLGWTSARIAESLGSSTGAIEMRLSRARRRLGGALTRDGIGPEHLQHA